MKPVIETVTGDFLGPRGLFESRVPPFHEKTPTNAVPAKA